MEDKAFYTPIEIAGRWGISLPSVLKMIRTGELPAMPVLSTFRISREALAAHEAKGTVGAAQ